MLGITFSAAEDLRKWREEVGLAADLLSDADRAVGLAYGAAADAAQEKAARLSFLIDGAGTIVKVYEGFDIEGHAEAVLGDLASG